MRENLSSGVCEQQKRRLVSAFFIRFLKSRQQKSMQNYTTCRELVSILKTFEYFTMQLFQKPIIMIL